MDDLLAEFLTESSESLAAVATDLVRLEQNPDDPTIVGNIFRLVHTIKGTCGFLGLPRLEKVAHAGENVLGRLRDRQLAVSPPVVSLVLQAVDRIRDILAALEATEHEPEGDDSALIAQLDALASAEGTPVTAAIAAAAAPAAAEAAEPETAAPSAAEPDAPAPQPAAQPAVAATTASAAPSAAPASGAPASSAPASGAESGVAAQSIRVNVALLETLMTTVSELVLTRNQLMQLLRGRNDSEFNAPLQRLSHVTTELQEGVMKTRMQPIGNAWGKLPRLVRDLGHELGKRLELKQIGAETELDRQVLELIKDPLTHMVRNSADHGIEGGAERLAAGKPEHGTITLNAFHEGGHIVIQIGDDGRGLAVEKIKKKALQNGLATEAELASMSEAQIQQFIFKAGFSTAAEVTSVSGRGVGMDVVRTNIEKIGGTIEMKSVVGKGTTFTVKIPLTLAIVSALIVECAGERFAIPQIGIVELVRAGGKSGHRIERLNGTPVLRLRERLLPLVGLQGLLQLDGETSAEADKLIIVAQVGTMSFGIIVDRVFDTEEIVVKPVAPMLREMGMYSGNTILGDGSVVMILDLNGIAGTVGELVSEETGRSAAAGAHEAEREETTSLLLFRAGSNDPKAVPLELVARLEEIDAKAVERANGRTVVQYRGKLMPLLGIDGGAAQAETGRIPVLVFAEDERSMGLVVDEIVDIVDEALKVELASDRAGVIGSAVIAGKATDILDVGFYLTQAFDDWFGMGGETAREGGGRRVLLVDDSAFFRNLMKPMLATAGYDVTAVPSAGRALELCASGADFDVIVSDIEMPEMDGYAFAETVRSSPRWQEKPLVALTSLADPEHIERGRQAGFIEHVAKSDRRALLAILSQTTTQASTLQRGAA
jgi:two-component system chemotaxis sensor kinase CheA